MTSSLPEICRSYLDTEWNPPRLPAEAVRPAITLSRETGAGAITIARRVAELLSEQPDSPAWQVYDRNLVEEILRDHALPATLQRFLPEGALSEIQLAIQEMCGLHPSSWTLTQYTSETVLRLTRVGYAIVVGRGGNLITAGLPHVLHVRLVAPPQTRILHAAASYQLDESAARDFVRKTDRQRAAYIRRTFQASIDDPHLYDLILNTARLGFDGTARAIVTALSERLVAAGA